VGAAAAVSLATLGALADALSELAPLAGTAAPAFGDTLAGCSALKATAPAPVSSAPSASPAPANLLAGFLRGYPGFVRRLWGCIFSLGNSRHQEKHPCQT